MKAYVELLPVAQRVAQNVPESFECHLQETSFGGRLGIFSLANRDATRESCFGGEAVRTLRRMTMGSIVDMSHLDKAPPNGDHDRIGSIIGVELREYVLYVILHCVLRDV
jgi:hypothetical protein